MLAHTLTNNLLTLTTPERLLWRTLASLDSVRKPRPIYTPFFA